MSWRGSGAGRLHPTSFTDLDLSQSVDSAGVDLARLKAMCLHTCSRRCPGFPDDPNLCPRMFLFELCWCCVCCILLFDGYICAGWHQLSSGTCMRHYERKGLQYLCVFLPSLLLLCFIFLALGRIHVEYEYERDINGLNR